jgi:RHS repeat-associated protein
MIKLNKINSYSFPLCHNRKPLPLYGRHSHILWKRISPGKSKKKSGKELDLETGFYYYGARYLDPKTSRWISGDPALGDYLPSAPVDEEAKKRNGSLPGQGGVFNLVNLHVYHYAGNNPVKYVDPDGMEDKLGLGAYVDLIKNIGALGSDIQSDLKKDTSDINQSDLMKRVGQMNEIFDAIGKSPIQFSMNTLAAGTLGALGYSVYENDDSVNGFVNSAINKAGGINDRLMSKGINVMDQTLTFAGDNFGSIKTKFGGGKSEKNVLLTADNSFDFRFNSSVSVSAQFGLGVNVSINSWNITPANMSGKIRLSLTF